MFVLTYPTSQKNSGPFNEPISVQEIANIYSLNNSWWLGHLTFFDSYDCAPSDEICRRGFINGRVQKNQSTYARIKRLMILTVNYSDLNR